jgi:O-antigen ligase
MTEHLPPPSATPAEIEPPVLDWLEAATVTQVGLLVLATTWSFGGQAETVRIPLTLFASVGAIITAIGLTRETFWRTKRAPLWRCFLPFVAFGALVLAGGANPSLKEVAVSSGRTLGLVEVSGWLPSSARPELGRQALWYFSAVWLSALNLLLFVRRGRIQRGLLILLAVNAVVLSVMGTLQKLSGSTGIYFGSVPVPQPRFFATFVYHNHWGAFTVLMLALIIGLGWHYVRTIPSRDIFQGPLAWVAFCILLLAVTLPLSGSRSCTLLGIGLLATASVHVAVHAARNRQERGLNSLPPFLLLAALWLGLIGGAWFVGRGTILDRLETSRSQLEEMKARGGIGDRALLYHNTWRMARDKPLFGWGMASYPHVFYGFYNTRTSPDRLPVFYNDAHNDWLQALAEHGFVGTALLVACAAVPLWHCRRSIRRSLITLYLISGLALVLAYALVEFPFGNRANVLTWWVLFFAALAYARTREHADQSPSTIPVRN